MFIQFLTPSVFTLTIIKFLYIVFHKIQKCANIYNVCNIYTNAFIMLQFILTYEVYLWLTY